MPNGFTVKSWWSNVEPGDPRWFYVYLLHDGNDCAPQYVGMARNIRRRLAEHARLLTAEGPSEALVIAVDTEAAARRLEFALIGLLVPPGNTAGVARWSWIERRYFEDILFIKWDLGQIAPCARCGCLYETNAAYPERQRAVTEPDPGCHEIHDQRPPVAAGVAAVVADVLTSMAQLGARGQDDGDG